MAFRALLRPVKRGPEHDRPLAAARAMVGSMLAGHGTRADGHLPFPLRAPSDQHHVMVASYNVHKCVGLDGRFDPARIVAVIAELNADVVALQEADQRFGERAGLLDARRIEGETGLRFLPVAERRNSHGWHGNALLVRQGTATRIERIALPCAEPRGAVLAEMDLPQGKLRVVGAHLGLLRHSRRRQGEAILEALREAPPMPTVLLGDLNEWRPSRSRSVFSALEPLFGASTGHHPSFPARSPIFALDRILGSPRGTVEAVAVHASPLARVASDHLPMKAWVNLHAPAYAVGAVDAA